MIKFITKRAAMFGLDARIALAIFGALSVISGAALYSAIRDARVTSIITYINEVHKAWEQYYLDTGTILGQYGTDNSTYAFYALDIKDLVQDPGITGWKGPYLQEKFHETSKLYFPTSLGNGFEGTSIQYLKNPRGTSFATRVCLAGDDCSLWITINGLSTKVDTSILKDIDMKIDGVDSPTTGNFMWNSDGWDYGYYKMANIKNPND